jgi:hypothetical protein
VGVAGRSDRVRDSAIAGPYRSSVIRVLAGGAAKNAVRPQLASATCRGRALVVRPQGCCPVQGGAARWTARPQVAIS